MAAVCFPRRHLTSSFSAAEPIEINLGIVVILQISLSLLKSYLDRGKEDSARDNFEPE